MGELVPRRHRPPQPDRGIGHGRVHQHRAERAVPAGEEQRRDAVSRGVEHALVVGLDLVVGGFVGDGRVHHRRVGADALQQEPGHDGVVGASAPHVQRLPRGRQPLVQRLRTGTAHVRRYPHHRPAVGPLTLPRVLLALDPVELLQAEEAPVDHQAGLPAHLARPRFRSPPKPACCAPGCTARAGPRRRRRRPRRHADEPRPRRFGHTRHPTELARLGTSPDAILDRIRTLLRHERQLTGELSHELRTPLSRIIAELDRWRTRPRTADQTRASREVIADAAESMRTLCDTLLDDTRGGTLTAPGSSEVLPTLRHPTESLDMPGNVTLTADGPPLVAGVPPALLERVVSPLLADACRYARSSVAVRACSAPDGVRVEITDDGPGVPAAFTGQLFEPGRRGDPDDGHGGAGLGLTPARRLAHSAGGEVTHDPGHTPGTRFLVSLPAGGRQARSTIPRVTAWRRPDVLARRPDSRRSREWPPSRTT